MNYNNSNLSKLACNFLSLLQHLAGHTPCAELWCFKNVAGSWMPGILWNLSHFQLHADAHTVNFIFRWPQPKVLLCAALQTSESRGELRFPWLTPACSHRVRGERADMWHDCTAPHNSSLGPALSVHDKGLHTVGLSGFLFCFLAKYELSYSLDLLI